MFCSIETEAQTLASEIRVVVMREPAKNIGVILACAIVISVFFRQSRAPVQRWRNLLSGGIQPYLLFHQALGFVLISGAQVQPCRLPMRVR